MTFSSKWLRHLLWDLGQSLGFLSHNCNPLFTSRVNLRRYKIHTSSTLPFIQQLFRYKTVTETRTLKESGRADSCKVCLYGSMRFPWAGTQDWLVSKALFKLNKAVFLGDFTTEHRAMLL